MNMPISSPPGQREVPASPALEALVGEGLVTIEQVVNARLASTPHSTFIVDAGRRYSFGEVILRCREIAAALSCIDPAGMRVASFLTHGVESVHAMLGTQLAGKAFAAINRPLRGQVLAGQLRRVQASILITEAAAADVLPAVEAQLCRHIVFVDHVPERFVAAPGVTVSTLARVIELGLGTAQGLVEPASLASLLFTSDTTGLSKAVRVPHNYLCRGAARLVEGLGFTDNDVIHGWSALSHIGGQMYLVMVALVSGATLALFPTFSASRFWDQVRSVDATFIFGFPNVAKILMIASETQSREHRLRIALLAGITPQMSEAFADRFGVRMVQAYGMTEAEPLAMTRVDEREPIGSLGRPAPDFEIAVVDELDQPVPQGEVGRIVARPRAPLVMMQGYEDDPRSTAEACRNGWFHSEDLGRLDADGYLFFCDRVKHAIRRRGENISSLEIENVLRSHGSVSECVVVGVPSELGEQDIKAIIVPAAGAPRDPRGLHSFCLNQLPRYMVPRYLEFRSELPMTESGKVRRNELDTLNETVWDADASA